MSLGFYGFSGERHEQPAFFHWNCSPVYVSTNSIRILHFLTLHPPVFITNTFLFKSSRHDFDSLIRDRIWRRKERTETNERIGKIIIIKIRVDKSRKTRQSKVLKSRRFDPRWPRFRSIEKPEPEERRRSPVLQSCDERAEDYGPGLDPFNSFTGLGPGALARNCGCGAPFPPVMRVEYAWTRFRCLLASKVDSDDTNSFVTPPWWVNNSMNRCVRHSTIFVTEISLFSIVQSGRNIPERSALGGRGGGEGDGIRSKFFLFFSPS